MEDMYESEEGKQVVKEKYVGFSKNVQQVGRSGKGG